MNTSKAEYQYENDGSLTIRHYNSAPPFSSFLPGIAGPWGIPMWVFYVNRGQGVCSFGLRDKDHPLAEFLSANWAYQLAFEQGFQTFIKIRNGKSVSHWFPFRIHAPSATQPLQVMNIRPEEVRVFEADPSAGMEIDVRYFTLPQEALAALVRTVRLKNTGSQPLSLQMLDGLSLIIPHGLNNFSIKEMRFIAQSHAEVTGLSARTPGFKTKASTEDSTIVEEISGMNFCFGYEEGSPDALLLPIVDRAAVYGASTDLGRPVAFIDAPDYRPPSLQLTENQLPSALLFSAFDLLPGEERTFHSFYGYAANAPLLADFALQARAADYVSRKHRQNRQLIQRLTQACGTASSHRIFDEYAKQNLLDNLLRGGFPTTLRDGRKPVVLSLYTRKHGDLERDYNYYTIEPTYYSQGESNYRDVNQNRRHDVFMNPDVGADTATFFINMIQADGFNPMNVKPRKFLCRDSQELREFAVQSVGKRAATKLLERVTKEFELGRLLTELPAAGLELKVPRDAFVEDLLLFVEGIDDSAFGSGYWSDHWHYNMDLLETFRGVYPERYAGLLFKQKDFVYGDSSWFVKPRSQKYVLNKGTPVQLNSVWMDPAKEALIKSRASRPHAVRTRLGRGPVYQTFLAPKLLTLAAVKLAALDAFGMGIEMESDRPNWYDALNGLPGQFGSSLSETFELKRLLLVLQEAVELAPRGFEWRLPAEVHGLVEGLRRLLGAPARGDRRKQSFVFWDKAGTLKEAYRESIRMGFRGTETVLPAAALAKFLALAIRKVDAGIAAARDRRTGLYHTYFRYEMTKYQAGPKVEGMETVKPVAFRQVKLPLFLEGQVHALRLETDPRRARQLVRAVRQSGLHDATLNMYKVNADLSDEPYSIGRSRTFARGWLENESIWLHMEYKYLLEILRGGLYQEFFEDFRHCAVPFMDPQVYGRSVTENSSFLVSDVYPDKDLVGRGFMARLSGATAEFIHLWVLMCSGSHPFRVGAGGALEAVFRPALPSWFFTTAPRQMELIDDAGKTSSTEVPAGAFAFVFLGRTLVVYSQSAQPRDTFGPNAAAIQSIHLTYADGSVAPLEGDVIPEPHASALRARRIRLVDARLG